MQYMSFKGYTDIDFQNPVPHTPEDGFQVMINPETFERSLGVKTEKDKTARSGNGSGNDAGLDAEKYAFDLIFDGTGVVGKRMTGEELDEQFQTFLNVVYAHRETEDNKKVANFVEISYWGDAFRCKMESMTIRYQLFQSNGYPIRIKVSCRFTSVEKPKTEDKDKKKGKKTKGGTKKPVNQNTPNHDCISPGKSFQETKDAAQQNDSVSMMTCDCSMSQMTPRNYTPVNPELNYTPADGSAR